MTALVASVSGQQSINIRGVGLIDDGGEYNIVDQIQIKMAQGAKPGEGGQLPGGKVVHNT